MVHSCLRGFTPTHLGVVWFIRFRVGSLGLAYVSSTGSCGFAQANLAVVRFVWGRVGSFGRARLGWV